MWTLKCNQESRENQQWQIHTRYPHLCGRENKAKQLLMAERTREPHRARMLIEQCDTNLETAAEARRVLLASLECGGWSHYKIRCDKGILSLGIFKINKSSHMRQKSHPEENINWAAQVTKCKGKRKSRWKWGKGAECPVSETTLCIFFKSLHENNRKGCFLKPWI